jgi:hypothetical protein
MRRLAFVTVLAGLSVCLSAPTAGADAVYHASHVPLHASGDAPLRSGFVQNIHANGPTVYAHENYIVNGAAPNTEYQVVLSIWASDTACSGAPTLEIPTAVLTTNAAGNGSAYVVFRPEDAGDLRGSTVSGMWTLATEGSVRYATDCEVITLD